MAIFLTNEEIVKGITKGYRIYAIPLIEGMLYVQDDKYKGNGFIEPDIKGSGTTYTILDEHNGMKWRLEDNFIDFGDEMGFVAVRVQVTKVKTRLEMNDYLSKRGIIHGLQIGEL